VVLRFPTRPNRLLTKKQLASELGRSTRWVELRMREGMPVMPRQLPGEHARFEFAAVLVWLEQRAQQRVEPVEVRVARLEREVARLTKALEREGP
jgi:phage terminase Nu1 subunit (DNA packaging protein)